MDFTKTFLPSIHTSDNVARLYQSFESLADMSDSEVEKARLIMLTADVVSAYVSNNHIQGADLPKLLGDVHEAIDGLSRSGAAQDAGHQPTATGQEIKRSITHDHLISFEDGKPYKTLRRHLTLRGLSPEQYRAKWGLPPDYPMTATSYSEQRSKLARALGLGQKRRSTLVASEPAGQTSEPSEAQPNSPVAPQRKKRAPKLTAA